MSINIFAQPAHTNTNPGQPFTGGAVRSGHLQRVSSIIRGEQIAARLGAALNPPAVQADDVCIYVKPHVKSGEAFAFQGRAWLDIVDGWQLRGLAAASPHVGVIACSETDGDSLRRILPNRVVVIPQHHCNFERAQRPRPGAVRTVGVIGTDEAFTFLPAGLGEALAVRGIRLECFSKFYTRADIADFYQRIDVQLVWRPYRKKLANPLKIINAASFGVPTIALDEPYFHELGWAYLPAMDYGGALSLLDNLRERRDLYEHLSRKCLEVSERYHIDAICEKYRELV